MPQQPDAATSREADARGEMLRARNREYQRRHRLRRKSGTQRHPISSKESTSLADADTTPTLLSNQIELSSRGELQSSYLISGSLDDMPLCLEFGGLQTPQASPCTVPSVASPNHLFEFSDVCLPGDQLSSSGVASVQTGPEAFGGFDTMELSKLFSAQYLAGPEGQIAESSPSDFLLTDTTLTLPDGCGKKALPAGTKTSVTEPPYHGHTALHIAAANNHVSIIGILLKNGASPSARDEHGQTPLHIAAKIGSESASALLASSTSDIDQVDHTGRTALHIAVEKGHESVITVLLRHGADVNR